MPPPYRLLVADDEAVVREVYRTFFAAVDEFDVCGEARTGAEAVAAYAELQPDLVLMDLNMPVLSGVEATRQICDHWATACVVVMTTFGTSEYVVAALRAGAAGYLLKDGGGVALVTGLRQALAGEMPLSGAVRRALVDSVVDDRVAGPSPPAPRTAGPSEVVLSGREQELLGWLAQGLTNHQIGTRLHVSEGSVKQYLASIGRKLGVTAQTAILIRAIQLGLVDPYAPPPT